MRRIFRGIDHTVLIGGIPRYKPHEVGETPEAYSYKCVLQNVGTQNTIISTNPTWHDNIMMDDGVEIEVCDFTFQGNALATTSEDNTTDKLNDGLVSLAVYENTDNTVIYYKEHYARVQTTKLD